MDKKLPISVCIIAKNEEKYIEGCLKKLSGYDWEIVVVDTGSTDDTVKIAKKYTRSVYHFDWCDDFSRAKNFAAKKAKNDMIISLDCDEYLEQVEPDEIIALLTEYPYGIGDFRRRDLIRCGDAVNVEYTMASRVYDRRYVRFEGRIHEQLRRIDGEKKASATLHMEAVHYGYYISDEENAAKNERNVRLLLKSLEETPEDPYILFQLGQSYASLGRDVEAYEARMQALRLDPPMDAPYTAPLIIGFGHSALNLGYYEEAMGLEGLFDDMHDLADYMFILGQAYFAMGRCEDAINAFILARNCTKVLSQGMNTYFPLNALSVIYDSLGDSAKAAECSGKAQRYLVAAADEFEKNMKDM